METTSILPSALIACLVALVIGIFLDQKFKVPLGIVSYVGAFLIGEQMVGLRSNQILEFFPSTVAVTIILAMTFFSFFSKNGATEYLGKKLMKPLRGKVALYPVLCLLISTVCYFMFNMMAVHAAIVPLLVLIGLQNGVSLPMIIIPAYLGQLIGSQNPFVGPAAANKIGYLNNYGISDPWGTSIGMSVTLTITVLGIFVISYLFFRGWKKGPDRPQYQGSVLEEKAQEMTPELKKSITVLVTSIILLVVPPLINTFFPSRIAATLAAIFDLYNVFSIGILACIILKINDFKTAIRSVNLEIIVLIAGVTTLAQVASKAGMVTLLQQLTNSVPDWLIVPAFWLMCAGLSFFVSGSAVVPSMWPIIVAIAKTPTQFIQLFAALYLGIAISGICPLSTSGVFMLSMSIPEDLRAESTKEQFKIAILLPIFGVIVILLGSMAVAGFFAKSAVIVP